jgi:hypothetical protein
MRAMEVTLERVDVDQPEAAERGRPRVYFHECLGSKACVSGCRSLVIPGLDPVGNFIRPYPEGLK